MHSPHFPRWIVVLGVCLPVALHAFPANSDSTIAELRRLEQVFGGRLGVMAKNLATGETVAYNAGERFPTASVIKLPVMAAFFDMVDRKAIDPAKRVTLTAEDKKPGSGVLQFLDAGATLSLLDAVRLMIILSDNTGTNLVLDRLGSTHEERLAAVNAFLQRKGLTQTRLLNRLYSWKTKQRTPEATRYRIGVTTPADMVALLEMLDRGTLADTASCRTMRDILAQQFYADIIPRLLPPEGLTVEHKTGGIAETKADVALVRSPRARFAIAVWVDKSADHAEITDNRASVLGARAARAIWNHFTGDTGYDLPPSPAGDVDWTMIPDGRWGIYRSAAAPFPHPARRNGFRGTDGILFPPFPHYQDSSIIVFVPSWLKEGDDGVNVIVHFHGWMNDNLGVLERYMIPQAMAREHINAVLVIPQGPNRARDSFGGKMEDPGGFRRLVEDVLATLQREKVVPRGKIGRVLVSAHSGGYRPAAGALNVGSLNDRITDVFLFDALYAQHDMFRRWLLEGNGRMFGAYTAHLAKEHTSFAADLEARVRDRLFFTPTSVDHDSVVQAYCADWLARLSSGWKSQ